MAAESTRTLAFTSYAAQVDGLNGAAACASRAYADQMYVMSLYESPSNCQPKTTAPAFGSCLCSKNYDTIVKQMSSRVVSSASCSGTETNEVSSLWSAFCSSATVAVAALAAGQPANTLASTTPGTLPSTAAGVSTTPSTASTIASLTSVSAGSSPTAGSSGTIGSTSSSSSSSSGLSTGAIVGIAIGGVLLVSILSTWLLRLARKNRYDHARQGQPLETIQAPSFKNEWGSQYQSPQQYNSQPYVQQPPQASGGQYPSGPTSPRNESQNAAIRDWVQDQPLYQHGSGPMSHQSGTAASSQPFSDGTRP